MIMLKDVIGQEIIQFLEHCEGTCLYTGIYMIIDTGKTLSRLHQCDQGMLPNRFS